MRLGLFETGGRTPRKEADVAKLVWELIKVRDRQGRGAHGLAGVRPESSGDIGEVRTAQELGQVGLSCRALQS